MQWCGLKSFIRRVTIQGTGVTTDAVVWIEIIERRQATLKCMSPLMQWCGLKFV